MKKLTLTILVATAPCMFGKPSLTSRAYNIGAGTSYFTLAALAALGFYDGATCIYNNRNEISEVPFHLEKIGYGSFCVATALGGWKLLTNAYSSFKEALRSSSLIEVTRKNYQTAVMESDKRVIIAVLPTARELHRSITSPLERLQEEYIQTHCMGTMTLAEATEVLGITSPSLLFIRNGNLVVKNGIYNEVQLRALMHNIQK